MLSPLKLLKDKEDTSSTTFLCLIENEQKLLAGIFSTSFFILSAGSSIHVLLNKKTNLSVEQSMLSVYTLFVLLEFAEV